MVIVCGVKSTFVTRQDEQSHWRKPLLSLEKPSCSGRYNVFFLTIYPSESHKICLMQEKECQASLRGWKYLLTLPMNCLSVFDHFVGLGLNGLKDLRAELTVSH